MTINGNITLCLQCLLCSRLLRDLGKLKSLSLNFYRPDPMLSQFYKFSILKNACGVPLYYIAILNPFYSYVLNIEITNKEYSYCILYSVKNLGLRQTCLLLKIHYQILMKNHLDKHG